jgi:hypothetical protein
MVLTYLSAPGAAREKLKTEGGTTLELAWTQFLPLGTQDTLDPLIRTRDELFYSWAPVGWSRVTADLQIVDPFLVRSETRAFFAIRWKVIF